ncbi:hypothetical protein ACNJC6_03007 [Acinetobacter johnsonii]|uniref:Uncharacterized protein n=1 Tax=Acinetobacter johnsonii TaxID=40214 RepID=A0A1R7QGN7_ACIJO|nr:hypothetical protein ACNJC6_03007 [Acinetobacter johnsonii]
MLFTGIYKKAFWQFLLVDIMKSIDVIHKTKLHSLSN